MKWFHRVFLMALFLVFGVLSLSVQAAKVIVTDAPDVQKLRNVDEGFRTSEIIGMDVYGNSDRYIGEIADFVAARGGYLYAVIEINEGIMQEILDLGDDEYVVVPWDQLRARNIE